MKQFLIRFQAEYYCQGYEYAWFERLVTANTYAEAILNLQQMDTADWEKGTPRYFKNLTL